MAKSKTSSDSTSTTLSISAPRGFGGSYTTDPTTGIRTLVTPATAASAPCCGPSVAEVVETPSEIPAEIISQEPEANEGGTLNG